LNPGVLPNASRHALYTGFVASCEYFTKSCPDNVSSFDFLILNGRSNCSADMDVSPKLADRSLCRPLMTEEDRLKKKTERRKMKKPV
jgi:hypothetical protein